MAQWLGNLSATGRTDWKIIDDGGTCQEIADAIAAVARVTNAQLKYMQRQIAEHLKDRLEETAPDSRDDPNSHPDPRYKGHLSESFAVRQQGEEYQVTTSEELKFYITAYGVDGVQDIRPIRYGISEYAKISDSNPGKPRKVLWWPALPKISEGGPVIKHVVHKPIPKNPYFDNAWNETITTFAEAMVSSEVGAALAAIADDYNPSYTTTGRVISPWRAAGYSRKWNARRGARRFLARVGA